MRAGLALLLLSGCSLTNVGRDLEQLSCDGEPFEFCDALNQDYPSGEACRVWRCHPTEKVCALHGSEFPEICDGVDNNCNGQVDEGMYTPTGAPLSWSAGPARFDLTAVAARRHSEDPRVVDTATVVVTANHTHGLIAAELVDMAEADDLFVADNRVSAAVAPAANGFILASSYEVTTNVMQLQWHSWDGEAPLLGGTTENLTAQSEVALAVDGIGSTLGLILSQDRAPVPIGSQECFVPGSQVELKMRRIFSAEVETNSEVLGTTFESYPPSVLALADDSYLVAYQGQVVGDQTEIVIESVDGNLEDDIAANFGAPSAAMPVGEPALAVSSDGTLVALVYREDCIDRDADGDSDGGEPAINFVLYGRQGVNLVELNRVEVARGISLGGPRRPTVYYQKFDLPDGTTYAEWLVAWEDGARQLLLSRFDVDGTSLEERIVLAESTSLSEGAHLVPGAGEHGVTAMTATTAPPNGAMLVVPLCQ